MYIYVPFMCVFLNNIKGGLRRCTFNIVSGAHRDVEYELSFDILLREQRSNDTWSILSINILIGQLMSNNILKL
jgi:hypothetical protein